MYKIAIIGLSLSLIALVYGCIQSNPTEVQQHVDLPEEYMSLSKDSNKPDTVLAFYDNDTIYIEFINKNLK